MSRVRQNFSDEAEKELNELTSKLLNHSYAYLSIAFHFDRDDQALPNFHKYFLEKSEERKEQAHQIMQVQNMRGGRILLQTVTKPNEEDWGSPVQAMEYALKLEKGLNTSVLHAQRVADSNEDPHLSDFIEDNYLPISVEILREVGHHLTNLKRVGSGLGQYIFDKETLGESN